MDYFKMVVGRRGIDPVYFWYDMSEEEVSSVYHAQIDEDRDNWERTRIIAYYSASAMGGMKKKIKQFMPFDWDNGEIKQPPKSKHKPSKDRMNQIMKKING